MDVGADRCVLSTLIRECKPHSYKHTYQHLLISNSIKKALKTGNYEIDNIF